MDVEAPKRFQQQVANASHQTKRVRIGNGATADRSLGKS